MPNAEALFILGLLSAAGLIFIRFLAGARHSFARQIEAEDRARREAECARRAREQEIHVAQGAVTHGD
jgi:regulator of protease activity HflC (stomatin/prohibitin superfamily)